MDTPHLGAELGAEPRAGHPDTDGATAVILLGSLTTRTERLSTAASSGVTLHAIHRGAPARPCVILLHGGGANLHWWDHLAPSIAERFHVVARDFRGHGESEYPEELVSGAFQRDLEALIEHLDVRDVALVGHSMGAHVALRHAARHGDVRAVVALEVSRGAGRRDSRRMRLALAARRTYPSHEEAVRRFRFLPPTPGAPEALRRVIAEHSIRPEEAGRFGYRFDRRWFGVPAEPPPELGRMACPCLVIRGTRSELLTREGAERLVADLPDARLVEIEGGHNVHLEQPAAVLAAILDHLGG